jgi:spore maturation protein CgeB
MPEPERRAIGQRARSRVLAEHTSAHRAAQLEGYAASLLDRERVASRMPAS